MIIIMLFLLRWRTADFPAHAETETEMGLACLELLLKKAKKNNKAASRPQGRLPFCVSVLLLIVLLPTLA